MAEIRNYEDRNAQAVLDRIEEALAQGYYRKPMDVVCNRFGIFDWFTEYLTATHLKQMRTFLREAIKLGYTGYVCFKVGAKYCANGMWAHKDPTTTGYSPDGPALYRSFTPSYTYWDITRLDGSWDWGKDEDAVKKYDELKTAKQLEAFIKAHPDEVYHV